MSEKNWTWMPHAAHFIGANKCEFRLATEVGGYIVSTVGEYFPLKLGQAEEIGLERKYETMVFKSIEEPNPRCACKYVIDVEKEVDFLGYNDPAEAYAGHMELCDKWSAINVAD